MLFAKSPTGPRAEKHGPAGMIGYQWFVGSGSQNRSTNLYTDPEVARKTGRE